jgi:uncharacterized protein YdhG (YjbR/CyaY superfamily)
MQSTAPNVDEYIDKLDPKWKAGIIKLRNIIKRNIPKGFVETMSYGMIGYVVPHSKYPDGYHVTPKLPLPFINVAAQKNYIAFYHMGLAGNQKLKEWFIDEYQKVYKRKMDMGKGCFRFSKEEIVPYDLIKELVQKISVDTYIQKYEELIKSR